jgi:Response regulator containing a CheY-like receiver domain and an HTH DNA-binding domain
LHITSRTVEFHKGQILDQLKLKTTADLIKYALTHGIVNTP